ncbi:MAG TPA: isoprenoid biosynthesis glyoxalase ElbB [Candidatus Kapabacteria bacterium]|nr:isoprenoid biosynthesis glyoxalase ElbB [Candidatus Kapabacteria bacterium]
MNTVAVILSGCGYLDGAEIRESVGVLWALAHHDVEVKIFAPDAPQIVVTNHFTQKATGETRNILTEAARIARGKIKPLSELQDHHYDALVMPGGFGVAKNLCTFATEGANGKLLYPEMEHDIRAMVKDGMPIGAVCIAPALIGLALKGEKLELTLGADGDAADELRKMGHTHFVTKPDEIHIDAAHKIVTTPAYMYDEAPLDEVFVGIKNLVDTVVSMI